MCIMLVHTSFYVQTASENRKTATLLLNAAFSRFGTWEIKNDHGIEKTNGFLYTS